MSESLSALILAAGKGVRMKSSLPKVLHPILGRPMVSYVVDAVRSAGAKDVHVVVGFGRDVLVKALEGENLAFVVQDQQLGTGHAVQCFSRTCSQPPKDLLIACGDTPLLSRETLQLMVKEHFASGNDLTMMTLIMADPGKYGRIIRDRQGKAVAIREAKDCTDDEKLIKEVNLAVYLFKGHELFSRLPLLKNNNNQKEYYLTDLVEMFAHDGLQIATIVERDESSTLGINSRADLALVSGIMKQNILLKHMEEGVTIMDPSQTFIEPGVQIGPDSLIWPGTTMAGNTRIGPESVIGPQTFIKDSVLGARVRAAFCCLDQAQIADETSLPPFSSLGKKGKKTQGEKE